MLALQGLLPSHHGALCGGAPDAFASVLQHHDWSASALGEPSQWPAELQDSLAAILASPFPMCIVWGPELSFLYNAAYAPLLAERHPGALGQPAAALWPTLWSDLAPLVEKARAGHSALGEDIIRTNRRHGREHERSFSMAYSPLCLDDGAPAGAVCVISETTAQQRQLQRQAFQLRVADELAALGDVNEIYHHACALLGDYLNVARVLAGDYDCERHLVAFHANYTDGTVPALQDHAYAERFGMENFDALLADGAWVVHDVAHDPRTCRADQLPAYEALSIRAAVAIPHRRVGALVSCLFINATSARSWSVDEVQLIENVAARMWDAAERARRESSLVQADRRKDQFLAMLAHELRNPLAPISSAAELLQLPKLDPDKVRSTGSVIARQAAHMTNLVDDLLDVSRVTSRIAEIRREAVDLRRVLGDAMEQVSPMIEARQHRVSIAATQGRAMVMGDYKRLVQVCANLINNAAKYTPQGGRINVSLQALDDYVVLRVEDNGVGIAPALLPHVFDMFAQAERSLDREKGGLGLGLALVKSLVELHDGSVTASSDGINEGSIFTVRLPRLHVDDNEIDSAVEVAPDKLRLLIVDDNEDGAEMLALFMEASGHEVVVEHSANSALARAGSEHFDAYLLDIGLPDMHGNELARQLRTIDQVGDALMVAITGYGHQADGATALKAGFDHYLVKPVDPGAIVSLLEPLRQRR
ncbi:MAG: ATP-binding protein [Gammaproteobacteria bacterium]